MKSGGMHSNYQLKPAAYQLVPLVKILHNDLNSILISDGVGVGKTISAGYILLYFITKYKQPGLVVCPPSLLIKWQQELETKFDINAIIVTTKNDFSNMENVLGGKIKKTEQVVYILPYSMLTKAKFSKKINFPIIAFDEIHNFRNKETRGYKAAKEFATHATYKVGLSATPINNSLDDLISEFSILFSNYDWDTVNMMFEDLWLSRREILTNSLVSRFTKGNLGIHFAKRNVNSFYVSYPSSYVDKVKQLISKVPSSKNTFFEKVTYYRLASSSVQAISASLHITEKLINKDPKVTKIQNVLKKIKKEKWIIFCEFSETVDLLAKTLSSDYEIFTMTGNTALFSRQETIEDFRQSKQSLLIMTPVGSEGLDVQFCSGVINYDLHWNPMRIEQRIGRIDRVGQKKNTIDVVNLIVDGSIDERVIQVIERKLGLISNSVFNLPSFIRNKNDNQMFDEKVLVNETQLSEKFINSMKNWESLPLEDYSMLLKINKKFCDINELKNITKIKNAVLFKNKNTFETWRKKFRKNSSEISSRLELYV